MDGPESFEDYKVGPKNWNGGHVSFSSATLVAIVQRNILHSFVKVMAFFFVFFFYFLIWVPKSHGLGGAPVKLYALSRECFPMWLPYVGPN